MWAAYIVLVLAGYAIRYYLHPAAPSGAGTGWWMWFDQGRYLESASAFLALDLNPARHWYPPGYSLLGAFGYALSRDHPFFLVNGALFACAAWAFVVLASALGVQARIAMVIFVLTTLAPRTIAEQWVAPWSTTPTAVIAYAALIAAVRPAGTPWLLLGIVAGSVLLFRPVEAVLIAPVVALALARDASANAGAIKRTSRHAGRACLGAALAAAAGAVLHLAIHGPKLSPYLAVSQVIGFAPEQLGLKIYVLFIDPRPVFEEGFGILRAFPWLVFGLVGIAASLWASERAIVAWFTTASLFLYSSYKDLLPTGLWHFNQIHYFKSLFPLLGILAWLVARDLYARRRLPAIIVAAAVAVPLLVVQLRLASVTADSIVRKTDATGVALQVAHPAFAVDFLRWVPPEERQAVIDGTSVMMDGVPLRSWASWRIFPVRAGTRWIPLAGTSFRTLVIDPRASPNADVFSAESRVYRLEWGFGRPCWFPRVRCGEAPT